MRAKIMEILHRFRTDFSMDRSCTDFGIREEDFKHIITAIEIEAVLPEFRKELAPVKELYHKLYELDDTLKDPLSKEISAINKMMLNIACPDFMTNDDSR